MIQLNGVSPFSINTADAGLTPQEHLDYMGGFLAAIDR